MEKKKQIQKPVPRYGQIPDAFVKYLRKNLTGFKLESAEAQTHIAKMILQAPSKWKEHSERSGYATFEAAALAKRVGRNKFSAINERLHLFEIAEDEQGRHEWSKKRGASKAYRLHEPIMDLLSKFLAGNNRRITNLLNDMGELSPLPAGAVASKRKDGQTTKGFKVPVETCVPVDMQTLKRLIEVLEYERLAVDGGMDLGGYQQELYRPEPAPDYLRDLLHEARHILGLTRNTLAPGALIHRYEQSDSGRLYALDTNFQNCRRVIRQAAMCGLYDYDIENCHFDILAQMAQQFGYTCHAIENYTAKKKKVRQDLANALGLDSVKPVKNALVALVYGARRSLRVDENDQPKDAIANLLGGIELARAFFNHPTVEALRTDIQQARAAILKGWEVSRQTIKNAMELTIDIRESSVEQQLAHLLQGVEAKALEAMHKVAPAEIVLLQHDGFTSTKRLDTDQLEAAILAATGYRLQVSTDGAITVDLDSALSDHPKKPSQNPLKSRITC